MGWTVWLWREMMCENLVRIGQTRHLELVHVVSCRGRWVKSECVKGRVSREEVWEGWLTIALVRKERKLR